MSAAEARAQRDLRSQALYCAPQVKLARKPPKIMSIQETLEAIRAASEPSNEEEAKFKVIAPILDGLGWSTMGTEVTFEQPVGSGKGAGRIDIALQGPHRLVALIEAKAPSTRLNGDHVGQLLNYAFYEGVDICALTTGSEWWFYLPLEQGPPEKRRFAVLKVREEPVDRLAHDFEDFLGRAALISGEARSRAKNVLEAEHRRALLSEQIPNIWQRMISEADEELVEAITQRVYEQINLRPDREQVVAVLRNEPVAAKLQQPKPARPAKPKKAPSTKPTGILLLGQRYPVTTYRQGFCELATLLYKRNPSEFLQLRSSGNQPLISNNSDSMLGPFEVSPGHWIKSHGSRNNLTKRCKDIMRDLGYKDSDFKFVFD